MIHYPYHMNNSSNNKSMDMYSNYNSFKQACCNDFLNNDEQFYSDYKQEINEWYKPPFDKFHNNMLSKCVTGIDESNKHGTGSLLPTSNDKSHCNYIQVNVTIN